MATVASTADVRPGNTAAVIDAAAAAGTVAGSDASRPSFRDRVHAMRPLFRDRVQAVRPLFRSGVHAMRPSFRDRVHAMRPLFRDRVHAMRTLFRDRVKRARTLFRDRVKRARPLFQGRHAWGGREFCSAFFPALCCHGQTSDPPPARSGLYTTQCTATDRTTALTVFFALESRALLFLASPRSFVGRSSDNRDSRGFSPWATA